MTSRQVLVSMLVFGARFVQQPVHAPCDKPRAPAAHHLRRDPQPLGHGLVIQAARARQHKAGAAGEWGPLTWRFARRCCAVNFPVK